MDKLQALALGDLDECLEFHVYDDEGELVEENPDFDDSDVLDELDEFFGDFENEDFPDDSFDDYDLTDLDY